MLVTLPGMSRLSSEEQSLNAPAEIVVTLVGIETVTRSLHISNAARLIAVIQSASVTFVSPQL